MVRVPDAARSLHLNVGDRVPFGFYTNAQTVSPGYGTGQQRPVGADPDHSRGHRRLQLQRRPRRLRSTIDDDVVQPGAHATAPECCSNGVLSGVQLDHGARDDAAVEAEIKQSLAEIESAPDRRRRRRNGRTRHRAAVDCARSVRRNRGTRGPARRRASDRAGAPPRRRRSECVTSPRCRPGTTVLDALVGVIASIVVGAILAAVVAVLLSRWRHSGRYARCTRPGALRSIGLRLRSVSPARLGSRGAGDGHGVPPGTAPGRPAAPRSPDRTVPISRTSPPARAFRFPPSPASGSPSIPGATTGRSRCDRR